jgi:hypothetical protein
MGIRPHVHAPAWPATNIGDVALAVWMPFSRDRRSPVGCGYGPTAASLEQAGLRLFPPHCLVGGSAK